MHRLQSRALSISVGTGAAPLDNAVTSDGRDLYVLNRSDSALAEFSVGRDAQLTAVGMQALPAGAAGAAASWRLPGGLSRRRLRHFGQAKPPAPVEIPGLLRAQIPVSYQMGADLPSRVEHRLVNGVAGRTKLGGQRVEGDPLDGERDEHAALPLAQ